MLEQHELRIRLVERRNRVYRAPASVFENELAMLLQWLQSQPHLAALVRELEAQPIELGTWQASGGLGWNELNFPDDEASRAKMCLEICRAGQARNYGHNISTARDFASIYRDFAETFLDPLVHYFEDRLEDSGVVVSVLRRYKQRTEWFERRELYGMYNSDTTHGESGLDSHLREFLVDQGISYPFSQPKSPSGEADVVSGLETDEPLALEIKLFLPDAGKGDAYLRQGFAQAVRYCQDYAVPVGYLVAFNLTPELLVFMGQEQGIWPPSVSVGDKTIYLIAIQLNPEMPSASKDRKLARHVVTTEYLLDQTHVT